MKLSYAVSSLQLSGEASSQSNIYLSNQQGGYLLLGQSPGSRYQGFFMFANHEMYRVIEHIKPDCNDEIQSINHSLNAVTRQWDTFSEEFFLPPHTNAVVYTLSKKMALTLILDCKKSYDNTEWGRTYEVEELDDTLLVTYTKSQGSRDKTEKLSYTIYVAIKGHSSYAQTGNWIRREYTQDKQRNSPPFDRYVHNTLSLGAKQLVFYASLDKQQALQQAQYVHKQQKELRENATKQKSYTISNVLDSQRLSTSHKMAYWCAVNALRSLYTGKDILAGHPWFFQSWSRDTLTSLKALHTIDRNSSLQILKLYVSELLDSGNLPNQDTSKAENADAIGWLFLRAAQLGCKDDHLIKALCTSINHLLAEHSPFAYAGPQQTWMDTGVNPNDTREGYPIELQAMRLHMYRYAFELTKDNKYRLFEQGLLAKVRSEFWNGEFLADRKDDFTKRPNVFIAAYAYPDLLTKKEWESCFDALLPALWCEWGGLSTIDKTHPLFTPNHTGQTITSYHRGDSWYWINNLGALVLHNINKAKYAETIKRMVDASTKEILWSGALGCHAELSSAQQQQSQGCVNQAWSNALFMELIQELR